MKYLTIVLLFLLNSAFATKLETITKTSVDASRRGHSFLEHLNGFKIVSIRHYEDDIVKDEIIFYNERLNEVKKIIFNSMINIYRGDNNSIFVTSGELGKNSISKYSHTGDLIWHVDLKNQNKIRITPLKSPREEFNKFKPVSGYYYLTDINKSTKNNFFNIYALNLLTGSIDKTVKIEGTLEYGPYGQNYWDPSVTHNGYLMMTNYACDTITSNRCENRRLKIKLFNQNFQKVADRTFASGDFVYNSQINLSETGIITFFNNDYYELRIFDEKLKFINSLKAYTNDKVAKYNDKFIVRDGSSFIIYNKDFSNFTPERISDLSQWRYEYRDNGNQLLYRNNEIYHYDKNWKFIEKSVIHSPSNRCRILKYLGKFNSGNMAINMKCSNKRNLNIFTKTGKYLDTISKENVSDFRLGLEELHVYFNKTLYKVNDLEDFPICYQIGKKKSFIIKKTDENILLYEGSLGRVINISEDGDIKVLKKNLNNLINFKNKYLISIEKDSNSNGWFVRTYDKNLKLISQSSSIYRPILAKNSKKFLSINNSSKPVILEFKDDMSIVTYEINSTRYLSYFKVASNDFQKSFMYLRPLRDDDKRYHFTVEAFNADGGHISTNTYKALKTSAASSFYNQSFATYKNNELVATFMYNDRYKAQKTIYYHLKNNKIRQKFKHDDSLFVFNGNDSKTYTVCDNSKVCYIDSKHKMKVLYKSQYTIDKVIQLTYDPSEIILYHQRDGFTELSLTTKKPTYHLKPTSLSDHRFPEFSYKSNLTGQRIFSFFSSYSGVKRQYAFDKEGLLDLSEDKRLLYLDKDLNSWTIGSHHYQDTEGVEPSCLRRLEI